MTYFVIIGLALDPDFRKMADAYVKDSLMILDMSTNDDQRLKRIWKYENEYDFVYGQAVGSIIGMLLGFFKGKYGRAVDSEESMEVREIVESHAKEIRERLAKFKK